MRVSISNLGEWRAESGERNKRSIYVMEDDRKAYVSDFFEYFSKSSQFQPGFPSLSIASTSLAGGLVQA